MVRYCEIAPYDVEVLEVCLAALGDRPHPAKAAAQGPPRGRLNLTVT